MYYFAMSRSWYYLCIVHTRRSASGPRDLFLCETWDVDLATISTLFLQLHVLESATRSFAEHLVGLATFAKICRSRSRICDL